MKEFIIKRGIFKIIEQRELDIQSAIEYFKSSKPLTLSMVEDFEKFELPVAEIKSVLDHVAIVENDIIERGILPKLVGDEFYHSWIARFDGTCDTEQYSTKKLLEYGCFETLLRYGNVDILVKYKQYDLLLEHGYYEELYDAGEQDLLYNYFKDHDHFEQLSIYGNVDILLKCKQYDILLEHGYYEELYDAGELDLLYNYLKDHNWREDFLQYRWALFISNRKGMDFLLKKKDFEVFNLGIYQSKTEENDGNGYTVTDIISILKDNGKLDDKTILFCTEDCLQLVGLKYLLDRGKLQDWFLHEDRANYTMTKCPDGHLRKVFSNTISTEAINKALKDEPWKVRNAVYKTAFKCKNRNKFLLKHGCLFYVLMNLLREAFSSCIFCFGMLAFLLILIFSETSIVMGIVFLMMGTFNEGPWRQNLGIAGCLLSLVLIGGYLGFALAIASLSFGIYGLCRGEA